MGTTIINSNETPRQLLGVDLGGTKTALIAGDSLGVVLGRVEFPTQPAEGYLAWLHRFETFFKNLKVVAHEWSPTMAGVSVGGPADWRKGVLQCPPNLPGWDSVPIRDDIGDVVGFPCRMEHDGRAGALAEWRFGAGRGIDDLIFLTFGTGIGAGIILAGKILRGACGSAGEVGHVRVSPKGPVAYGKAGSLESFASGVGIARLAAQLYPDRWPTEPTAREIIQLAGKGDIEAQDVLDESADKLGLGLAMLTDMFNPQIIILGSLADRLNESYLIRAISVMRLEALSTTFNACRVVRSALGDRLQDVAALMAATDGV